MISVTERERGAGRDRGDPFPHRHLTHLSLSHPTLPLPGSGVLSVAARRARPPIGQRAAAGAASRGPAAGRGGRARLRSPTGPEREEWSPPRRPTICRSRLPKRKTRDAIRRPFCFGRIIKQTASRLDTRKHIFCTSSR